MSLHDAGERNGQSETIAALATPEGESGLAVVRLSGTRAIAVAQEIFRHPEFRQGPTTHRAYHGVVIWPERASAVDPQQGARRGLQTGQEIDEVIALVLLAPRSYTGEDSVEFCCHGGRVPARLVLEACWLAGAVPAGPGEFTRRAFLNGKLSLDQAEAVADLIHAENELTATASLKQLKGGFDQELRSVEEPLQELLADLEGGLEFTEAEGVDVSFAHQVRTLQAAKERLEYLLSLAPSGRRLREGVQVVLVGPPNVGKSSLFNALLGESRVLVDQEPGTTRDLVTARIRKEGILFVLHDTAGLRDQGGRVEKMGMELTQQAMNRADVILTLQETPGTNLEELKKSISIDNKNPIHSNQEIGELIVLTKIDKTNHKDILVNKINQYKLIDHIIPTSSHTGEGLKELWDRLLSAARQEEMRKAATLGIVMNARHQKKLMECLDQLSSLHRDLLDNQPGSEIVASWLAGILSNLGEVSGRIFSESILDSVFARFCVGK